MMKGPALALLERCRLFLLLIGGVTLAGVASIPGSGASDRDWHHRERKQAEAGTMTGDAQPPADKERVEAMERRLRAAMKEKTNVELIRFIARYPDRPLADTARTLLRGRGADRAGMRSGPDGRIYAEFDKARLQHSVSAFERFVERHPNHPLAAEAQRWIEWMRRRE